MSDTRRFATFVRAQVAGIEACSVQAAATYLHTKLAERWLPTSLGFALRRALEQRAGLSVTAEMLALSAASRAMAQEAARRGAARLASQTTGSLIAGTALKQVIGGVGRASAAGFVVDGAVGGVEAYQAVRKGQMTTKQAWRHVGIEGVTGAIACGAGVALTAGIVVATGGLAPAAVLGIAAVSSTGVKLGLRKAITRSEPKRLKAPPALLPERSGYPR